MTFRTCHRNRLAIFTWLSFVVLFFRASSPMYAQTFWADNAGDWNTAANWSLGVPDAGSATAFDAVIENGGTAQLTSAPVGSVRRFRIGRAAGAGNVLVDAATLNVTQDMFLNENGTSASTVTVRNAGTVTAPTASIGQSSAANSSLSISGAGTSFNAATQFIVGNSGPGAASLTVDTGAALSSGASFIGNGAGSTGTATVQNPGSAWSSTGALAVGSTGTGTLNILDQGLVYVGTNLSINATSTVNLNGGTLRFNGYSRAGAFNYLAGTIQLAGDRVFGNDLAIPDIFGALPTIPAGKTLNVEGGADVRTNVAVNGGKLAIQSNSNLFRVGFLQPGTLSITGGGSVVSNTQSDVGVQDGDNGTVNVSGLGSSLTVNNALYVGLEGKGTMNITGGGTVTTTGDGVIGFDQSLPSTATGTVLVSGAGSTWNIGDDLGIGSTAGAGTLTIESGGLVYVTHGLFIDFNDTLNLNGGTIRFDQYVPSSGAAFNFASGTIQLAGNRTLGADSIITQHFGSVPVIPAGKGLTVEGNATISSAATLNGGTLRATNLIVNGSFHFGGGLLELTGGTITGLTSLTVPGDGEFRAAGVQSLQVTGAAGSTITATGALTLGAAAAVNGFGTQGTLQVGANTVTLLDSNDVVFDSLSLATLGAAGSPGTLAAANGLTLDFGGNLTGFGTVTTPNNIAKPLINNGHITGASGAERIALPGYVKGAGTFDNVNFTGTFSPGLSPTISIVGSVAFSPTSTLIMELGGTAPGSGYDQLQSSGTIAFDGNLQVSLIDSFSPAAGQSFNLFDGASSGAFDALQLPTLAGGLTWNTSLLYTDGRLSVVAPGTPPGDYNDDGTVAAADYVVWRKFDGTSVDLPNDPNPLPIDIDQYNTWRTNFGEAGSGAGGASNEAVPEPASVIILLGVLLSTLASHGRWR